MLFLQTSITLRLFWISYSNILLTSITIIFIVLLMYDVIVTIRFCEFELAITVTDHLFIYLIVLLAVMSNSFFLYVSVAGVESYSD